MYHGLDGDSIRSWTHEPSGVCWIRGFLPNLFPDARVMTYGYDAKTQGIRDKSSASVFDHALDLLNHLACERSDSKVSVLLS